MFQENIKNKENSLTNTIILNAKLNSVFGENIENEYFGKLEIAKINLNYFVYNSYSSEKLKILPCKFSGDLNQPGNICIIGHNYFDNRFFSNLNQLELYDEIIIEDLYKNRYKYIVYDIYEIDENEINRALENDGNYKTLTLCTCTFNKNKRLIIKAKIYI
jgi:LPXTG-site transpeptidase (sortase) family protein